MILENKSVYVAGWFCRGILEVHRELKSIKGYKRKLKLKGKSVTEN